MPTTVGLWEHFTRLLDFDGREDRASFWPYAAVAFIIVMVVSAAIFIPMMIHAMAAMQQYAGRHPNDVTVSSGPGHYRISIHGHGHPQFFERASIMAYLCVTFGLSFLLYAGAVVRRLHDRGMSGFWGLMPVPFIVYSSFVLPAVFASTGRPSMGAFISSFVSNMLYMVTLIALIVLLAGAGIPGPNRFDSA